MRTVNQPQSWWGWHGWNKPEPLSIVEIMQADTMPPRLAAAFWIGLERGASFIFAADPPGSGKTTVLTALLAFARPETVAYFTRGWGETFDLPPISDEYPTYLMVNEISDHLPVYSWGPYVVRIFELVAEGYSFCSTLHADTVEQVIEQLELDAGVPRAHLANLTFVVTLAVVHREGATLRRVRDVGVLGPGNGGLSVERIATWNEREDVISALQDEGERALLAARLGLDGATLESELGQRERFLKRLLSDGVRDMTAVQEAIDGFRAGDGEQAAGLAE